MANIIVKLRFSNVNLVCTTSEYSSLIALLEANSICVEYQCRKGYCGSCRTRLLKGKIKYTNQPLASVQQDEILLCCCMANGDIEIDL